MPSAVETNSVTRREILEMMAEKDKLEQQLKSFLDSLQSQRVGMDEPLVDDNDFPRDDIDVYQIRIIRNRVICTSNDLKELLKRIEKSLNTYFTQQHHNASEHMVNGNCSLKPEH